MGKAVFCIAHSENQAERMVSNLKRSGFRDGDISVLFADKSGHKDLAHEMRTKASQGMATGVIVGGVVGSCFGWLMAVGMINVPGLEGVAAAGPVMAALSGASVGATLGGIPGALVGFGIPEIVAKRYQGKIGVNNIVISVHAETMTLARVAKRILNEAGCRDASITGEAEAPRLYAT